MMWYCAALSGLSHNIGEDDRGSEQQCKKSDQQGQNQWKMAKNLPQCHFVQHESYMNSPKIQPGPLYSETPELNRLSICFHSSSLYVYQSTKTHGK
jgi:hypothetical protein